MPLSATVLSGLLGHDSTEVSRDAGGGGEKEVEEEDGEELCSLSLCFCLILEAEATLDPAGGLVALSEWDERSKSVK